jgi:DNA-binding NarL/FixJ family response regulator
MAYRFLIVDDTSFMRKMAADCLREFGYEVVGEASNGKEAVQMFEELQPDVVLMDLTMPEMSGCDAIKAILGINPDAVVLICSASNQKELIVEAMDAGAKGYLMKPFNSNRLLEVIRKYAEPYLTTPASSETDVKPDETEESPVGHVESEEIAHEVQPPVYMNLNRGDRELKSFISSFMCQWQEERNGETVEYSAVCTESENKLLIERKDANHEKQVIPFTLDGFRQLAGWLDNHMSPRLGAAPEKVKEGRGRHS